MEDAVRWFEQHDAKAAGRFTDDLLRVFVLIGQLPTLFALTGHRGIRRAVLKRYPYLIFYVEWSDRVEVLTIADARRNPSAITRQVNRELRKPSDPA